jgi:hypothetical protein
MQSPLLNYASAIAAIESGGNYGALGPQTSDGDRAYGKYQVMGKNIPAWTKIATGSSMSPDDFLKDPDAQDQVFNHYFGSALNQYGNPQDAASVWFSGKPMSQGAGKSDGYNTGAQYVAKFNKALADQQQSPMAMAFADPTEAPQPAPGSPNAVVANDFSALQNSGAQTPATRVSGGFDAIANSAAQTPATRVANGFSALPPQNITPANVATDQVPQDQQPPAAAPQSSSGMSPTMMNALNGMGPALEKAGAGLLSIYNPGGGAALSQAANSELAQRLSMQKPQWGVIGKDMFGQEQYGWINPNTQTVKPAGPSSDASGGSTSSPNSGNLTDTFNSIINARQNGASTADLVKMVPPVLQGDLSAMLNNTAVPSNLTRQGPMRNALITMAHAIDPSFDETKLPGRIQFQKNLDSQSMTTIGGQRQALGTMLDHLTGVGDSAIDLGNTNGVTGVDMEARADNAVKNMTTTNAAKVNKLNDQVEKYVGEVGKLYSGNQGGGVAERETSRSHFSGNMAPASLAAGLEAELGLAQGKYNQMQAQADEALGPGKVKIIGPEQQAAIQKVQEQIAALRHQANPNPTAAPAQSSVPAAAPTTGQGFQLPSGWSVQVR